MTTQHHTRDPGELSKNCGTAEDTTRIVKTADTAIISPSERCSSRSRTCSGDGVGPEARDLIWHD